MLAKSCGVACAGASPPASSAGTCLAPCMSWDQEAGEAQQSAPCGERPCDGTVLHVPSQGCFHRHPVRGSIG